MESFVRATWHLDEVYVTPKGGAASISSEMQLVARGRPRGRDPRELRHEGELKKATPRFMKRALKRRRSPETITTDGLRSDNAAMTTLGNTDKQKVRRWANNRV